MINLTKGTFSKPASYTITAYSTDGEKKWKKGSIGQKDVAKMLNKGMELWMTNIYNETVPDSTSGDGDRDSYVEEKKKPNGNTTVISFAPIAKSEKAPKLVVNYEIFADSTGETAGQWAALSTKGGTTAVKEDIEVCATNSTKKAEDSNGWGTFCPTEGVFLKPLTGDKATKSVYLIRTAAKDNGDGTYTAAGKPKKISVSSQLKKPKYKISKSVIKVKKNSGVIIDGGVPMKYESAASMNVGEYKGKAIEIWTNATAKKPASAKQKLTAN